MRLDHGEHSLQRSKEIWGLRKEPDGALNPGLSRQALGAASIRLHRLHTLCQPKGLLQGPKDLSVVRRTWEACPANGSLVTRAWRNYFNRKQASKPGCCFMWPMTAEPNLAAWTGPRLPSPTLLKSSSLQPPQCQGVPNDQRLEDGCKGSSV